MRKCLIVLGCLFSLLFFGCSDDNDSKDSSSSNYFTYKGKKYSLENGLVHRFSYGTDSYGCGMYLYSSGLKYSGSSETNMSGFGNAIYIELYSIAESISSGTYTFTSDEGDPYTAQYGEVLINWDSEPDESTPLFWKGSLVVEKSSSSYKITCTGYDEDNNEVYITYSGSLIYYDSER